MDWIAPITITDVRMLVVLFMRLMTTAVGAALVIFCIVRLARSGLFGRTGGMLLGLGSVILVCSSAERLAIESLFGITGVEYQGLKASLEEAEQKLQIASQELIDARSGLETALVEAKQTEQELSSARATLNNMISLQNSQLEANRRTIDTLATFANQSVRPFEPYNVMGQPSYLTDRTPFWSFGDKTYPASPATTAPPGMDYFGTGATEMLPSSVLKTAPPGALE